MTFLRPGALWLLLLVPIIAAFYAVTVWRQQKSRPASFAFTTSDRSRTLARRRHVPIALFILAIAALLFSLARPEANVTLPVRTGQIVLAFDTSNSMLANDVTPNRLDAAKELALRFVDQQPSSVQIAVVAFTDGGLIVQPPTKDQVEIRNAIARLNTDGGTSIGEGIFASLTAIANEPIELDVTGAAAATNLGSIANAAIIVFTDGEEIGGADPLAVASLAGDAGVPIYTVGVGTPRGTVVALDGFNIATALDESVLTEIAETANGQYFLASDDPSLAGIFDEIDRRFERQGERIEITALLSMAAMGLAAGATIMSVRWFGRV